MTLATINTGPPNSGQGDSPKAAFDKINANFVQVNGILVPSSLPLATSLVGTEITVVTQSGNQVQTSLAAIAALATQGASIGSPGLTNASLSGANSYAGNLHWTTTASIGSTSIPSGSADLSGVATWSVVGGPTFTGQVSTPGAANLAAAVQSTIMKTATTANSNFYLYNTSAQGGNALQAFRQISAGPAGGFILTAYFWMAAVAAGQAFFCGMTPVAIGAGTDPSTSANVVGFSLDAADTNLQFIYNNGSGNATKTSTGIAFASLLNHFVRMTIACDAVGNVVGTFADLEPTGNLGTFSLSVPAATAKLPAQNASIMPFLFNSTRATGVATGIGFHAIFFTNGLIT